ncbi:hypothetical protein ABQF17_14985 [Mycolicibacterium elephantis]
MDNNETVAERDKTYSDAIFHLHKPTARENGQSADLTVTAEDVSHDNSGDYRLAVTIDTHVWLGEGWGDTEEPERLARLVMNADSARNLARQLTAVAAKVDESNCIFTGSREDLSKFLGSMDSDGRIYVEYDEVDSVYRWADLQSILY